MPANYEFSEAQNVVIRSVARPMRLVGTIVVALAVLAILGDAVTTWNGVRTVQAHNAAADARAAARLVQAGEDASLRTGIEQERERAHEIVAVPIIVGIFGLIGALMLLSLGRSLRNAGSAFHKIVDTAGNDIEHTMDAVRELASAYSLGRIIVIYLLAVSVIAGIAIVGIERV